MASGTARDECTEKAQAALPFSEACYFGQTGGLMMSGAQQGTESQTPPSEYINSLEGWIWRDAAQWLHPLMD